MIDSFSATVGPYVLKSMVACASRILAWSGLANTHAHVDAMLTDCYKRRYPSLRSHK